MATQQDIFDELDKELMDERLLDCQMSVDGNEIVCADKIYVLSGKANKSARINSKADLKEDKKPIKKTGVKVIPE